MGNFINEEIKNKLILDFGMDNTIRFCEMVSDMYEMLHKDVKKKQPDEYYKYDYGYESEWWKNKYNELKKRKDERNGYIGTIS